FSVLLKRQPITYKLFPYTTLFRSRQIHVFPQLQQRPQAHMQLDQPLWLFCLYGQVHTCRNTRRSFDSDVCFHTWFESNLLSSVSYDPGSLQPSLLHHAQIGRASCRETAPITT